MIISVIIHNIILEYIAYMRKSFTGNEKLIIYCIQYSESTLLIHHCSKHIQYLGTF